MRLLAPIFFLIILISSCHKDEIREFTSDYQDQFSTYIEINYNEANNNTSVLILFFDPYSDYYYQSLKLPKGSYIKINDVELKWESGYHHIFKGKPNCKIEFKDIDGLIYKNTLIPPDTAYFINLSDTVLANEDLEFQVNAPALDSNEYKSIFLDDHGDDYWHYAIFGTDSIMTISSFELENQTAHTLFLYRKKGIKKPNLPIGGGSIEYSYNINHTFYIK